MTIPVNQDIFCKPEVGELIQKLSMDIHGDEMRDAVPALAVLVAFCIDASSNKSQARQFTIDLIDFVLERAGEAGAMNKVNQMFGRR